MTKTTPSVERTEQLGGGRIQEEEEHPAQHQEHPGFDSSHDVFCDNEADLGHASPRAIEPALEDGTPVCGERQGTVLSTPRGLPGGRSSDNVTGSDDQTLSKDKLETQADDDASIKDIYDSPVANGVSRQVAFLSGTMGLTVDISDPTQPQPPDELWQQEPHNDHAQFPASPCSGVILETSPRYDSLQIFRKEMSSRGINAQARRILRCLFIY